jgi:hypothetical protein
MAASAILDLLVPSYLSQFSSDFHEIMYVGNLDSQEGKHKIENELKVEIKDDGVRHLEFTCVTVTQSFFIQFS